MEMSVSCGLAAECHERMPVLLAPDDYGTWTGGDTEAARAVPPVGG